MKWTKAYFLVICVLVFTGGCIAQTKPDKVSHAEPLYYDLVRDLGARKGEREINAGAGFSGTSQYKQQAYLVEYEFAPINRLGFEIEADFDFFKSVNPTLEAPGNKLEGLRFSSQYSFLVSTQYQTTLAAGYTQIMEFTGFENYGKTNLLTGTVYNPFFIAAKRWEQHFHSLIYISPLVEHNFLSNTVCLSGQINTSFHYIFPGTKHFIGVELNKEINANGFKMTIRPQVKFKLLPQLALGLAAGIPANTHSGGFSCFFRLIYEP